MTSKAWCHQLTVVQTLHKYYFASQYIINISYWMYNMFIIKSTVLLHQWENIYGVFLENRKYTTCVHFTLYRIFYTEFTTYMQKNKKESDVTFLSKVTGVKTRIENVITVYCIVWIPKTMFLCFDKKFNYNQQGDVPLCYTDQSRNLYKDNIFRHCAVIIRHDITFQRVVPKQLW